MEFVLSNTLNENSSYCKYIVGFFRSVFFSLFLTSIDQSCSGVALKSPPEECRVNPANNPLTPIQVQFYSNITNNILGESHQLCLLSLQVNFILFLRSLSTVI